MNVEYIDVYVSETCLHNVKFEYIKLCFPEKYSNQKVDHTVSHKLFFVCFWTTPCGAQGLSLPLHSENPYWGWEGYIGYISKTWRNFKPRALHTVQYLQSNHKLSIILILVYHL